MDFIATMAAAPHMAGRPLTLECDPVTIVAGSVLLGAAVNAGSQLYQGQKQEKAAKKAREDAAKAAGMAAEQSRRSELRAEAAKAAQAQQVSLDDAVEVSQSRHRRGVASTFLNDQNETL